MLNYNCNVADVATWNKSTNSRSCAIIFAHFNLSIIRNIYHIVVGIRLFYH